MCLHKVYLFLQFVGVGPIVVAFACGDVFPFGTGVVEDDVHPSLVSVGVFVFCFEQGEYLVGVAVGILFQDAGGVVGGGVVVYKYFHTEVGVLHQEPVKTLSDERFVIVCKAADAYERGGGHVTDSFAVWRIAT